MRRLLTVLVLLAIAGGLIWWFALRAPAKTVDEGRSGRGQDIPVVLAAATTADVPIYLDGLGTVQASATVTVHPQVDGVLTEVDFKEGQDVKQGDILARIDPRTYQASLDQAIAKRQQDAASLANARVDLGRYQKLAASAYTSAQQSDTQKAQVAQDEAQVAQDQGAIDNARTQLSYTTIIAPISGRAGIRQVDRGNLVHATDANGLVVLTTLRPIDVVFTLPQQQLRQISRATAKDSALEVVALPQGLDVDPSRDVLDTGTLTVLDNQVDPTTGTLKLKASFPNEKLQLWPGAFVTVRLKTRTLDGATVVPTVALQRGPQGAFVWTVGDNKQAQRRAVTTGHEERGETVISDGLKPGEMVVVDGASRLTDDAKIVVAQPAGTVTPAPPATGRPSHRRAPAVAGGS